MRKNVEEDWKEQLEPQHAENAEQIQKDERKVEQHRRSKSNPKNRI